MSTPLTKSTVDIERLEEILEGSGALFLEPRATFDRAIIGLAERINMMVVAYDRDLTIQAMVDVDGMDHEEAMEFFEFNTAGAWVGEGTPIFISRLLLEDDRAANDAHVDGQPDE
jgi:hypothetical protein